MQPRTLAQLIDELRRKKTHNRERLTPSQAKKIAISWKKSDPITVGVCDYCLRKDDVYPAVVEVCKNCAIRFMKNGLKPLGLPKLLTTTTTDCTICNERIRKCWYFNPKLCGKCIRKSVGEYRVRSEIKRNL